MENYKDLIGKSFRLKTNHSEIEKVIMIEDTSDAGIVVLLESTKQAALNGVEAPYFKLDVFIDLYEEI